MYVALKTFYYAWGVALFKSSVRSVSHFYHLENGSAKIISNVYQMLRKLLCKITLNKSDNVNFLHAWKEILYLYYSLQSHVKQNC